MTEFELKQFLDNFPESKVKMKWYNKHFHYTYYKFIIPMTYRFLKVYIQILFYCLLVFNFTDLRTANKIMINHLYRLMRIKCPKK